MKRLLVSALLLATISGCAQPSLTPPAPTAVSAASGGVTAFAQLAITGAAGRQVLEASSGTTTTPTGMQPWRKADIHHVTLELYRGQDKLAGQDVLQAELDRTVVFSNLVRNATYRVVARAFAGDGVTPIDNGAVDPASCTTTFSTQESPDVQVGPLQLRLIDKVFSGTSNPVGIAVTDGVVKDDSTTEAITINPPTTATLYVAE